MLIPSRFSIESSQFSVLIDALIDVNFSCCLNWKKFLKKIHRIIISSCEFNASRWFSSLSRLNVDPESYTMFIACNRSEITYLGLE